MFDTGSTGFMLIATSLVMLMTPGLAFFTADLQAEKCFSDYDTKLCIAWMDYSNMVCFWIFIVLQWGQGAVIGDLNMAFLAGTDLNSIYTGNNQIPLYVFVYTR